MPHSLRCVIMRGGTSKAVFLKEADIPADPEARRRLILAVYGSPDRRQIDGLGGADPLTSKLAIIGPPREALPRAAGTHLTYTFGQVEIDHPEVDWRSLCGNISAAVGVFAVYEGMVTPTAPVTVVRAYNTNLDRVLRIEVPVENGRPLEHGDYVVPGVPGSGARIMIDFADTAGGATGRLLPTGRPVDRLEVPGFGPLDVSLVDIGNAHVFLRAHDLGLTGTETAAEIDAKPELRALVERIRGMAAERMGMVADAARAREESPATPLLGMVGPPADYRNALAGGMVTEMEVDLVSRLMFMQQMHKTYAGTSTVCTGVAARLAGTLVHEVTRPHNRAAIRIGHPAGVIEIETEIAPDGTVRRATLGRTARRILEGRVFVPVDWDAVIQKRRTDGHGRG
ncbi:3-methylitaconate isomerase [Dankookia rubra]|uniref:3-methylitaconate isomerase n=1 Tax=Dankookia rubra TaxID=1442381 RepID=A0A4R5QNL4_9PROT|nr:PrpF domain-containing protein [Dankookia rubra]TDH64429.1 3-methylitaconate isomerase [Dankookia rubra]